jgi:hypothetical protein
MKIWIDMTSGTWGDANDIVTLNVLDVELEELDSWSTSDITGLGAEKGVPIPTGGVKCALCFLDPEPEANQDAWTIVDGYAVCGDHLPLVLMDNERTQGYAHLLEQGVTGIDHSEFKPADLWEQLWEDHDKGYHSQHSVPVCKWCNPDA